MKLLYKAIFWVRHTSDRVHARLQYTVISNSRLLAFLLANSVRAMSAAIFDRS